ncbi:hypothetical protein [Eptesicus fuscus gammaherpesvirus]|uniref:Uncharacterized protein n=1 Tax=vespertilionid gammaherpesvirus 3 TaxID=2846598 RepID=A0A2D1A3J2_9GAMA|nr:hypothetical protein [Eptesicus fuscus gammaherpesvirus]ATA58280.1 hypothetical protein [Eptesicus fuscus gammaherpesvirus]WAH70927.1 hypothetical protein [Eptesicus fuscus gammaherpesvirus]
MYPRRLSRQRSTLSVFRFRVTLIYCDVVDPSSDHLRFCISHRELSWRSRYRACSDSWKTLTCSSGIRCGCWPACLPPVANSVKRVSRSTTQHITTFTLDKGQHSQLIPQLTPQARCHLVLITWGDGGRATASSARLPPTVIYCQPFAKRAFRHLCRMKLIIFTHMPFLIIILLFVLLQ